MLLPLFAAVMAAGVASAQQGKPAAGDKQPASRACPAIDYDDETGWIPPQEIQDIFYLLLNSADDKGIKYDADLNSQSEFGKPARGPTKPFYKNDLNSLQVMGTPAAAAAANTGLNTRDQSGELSTASRIFIHIKAVRQITGGRRGTAAFLLAHEFKHLINEDPEKLEQNNLKHYYEWCATNQKICDTEEGLDVYTPIGDAARDAFLRPLENAADLQADAWITKLVDPKTGKPFGPEAGPQAIKDLGCWMAAMETKGILVGDNGGKAQHASVAERIKALRARQKEDKARLERLKAKNENALGKVRAP